MFFSIFTVIVFPLSKNNTNDPNLNLFINSLRIELFKLETTQVSGSSPRCIFFVYQLIFMQSCCRP